MKEKEAVNVAVNRLYDIQRYMRKNIRMCTKDCA